MKNIRETRSIKNAIKFTLLELLIVCAIIMLLASIFLPALKRAHQTAKEVQCKSNLRQMSTGANMYIGDYSGWIIPAFIPARSWASGIWFNQLSGRYYSLCDYQVKYPEVFKCPSEDTGFGDYHDGLFLYTHYAANLWLSGKDNSSNYVWHNSSSVTRPSVAIIFIDSARKDNYGVSTGTTQVSFRHSAKCCLTYVDGHSESKKFTEIHGETPFKKGFNL